MTDTFKKAKIFFKLSNKIGYFATLLPHSLDIINSISDVKGEEVKSMLWSMVLIVSALFTTVLAKDAPRAVIVFDASGSMWGQIHGKAKIEIAREALKNVVKEWNQNVELGLTVYGHRKKGDCNDIENIIPVGKIDKQKIIRTVMAIQPKGKTPISRSLYKAADELKYTEEKATIILISDGKETCDPDPCGMAKELKKQGIDFVTHVIGFNVDKKTDKQLECIAHATGGEYFSAKDASSLNKAIKAVAKKVEVVKPAPKPAVKKLDHTLEVSASEKEGGKWVRASHIIYEDENGKPGDNVTSKISYKKKPGKLQLPVGKYILVSRYNNFKRETPFEIKQEEVTKIHVVMGQTGMVEISASEKEGGKWVRASHIIYEDENGKPGDNVTSKISYKKKPGKLQLPVGKYILVSRYNNFKRETPFEIKSEEVAKIHVVMGQTGMVEISASESKDGKWVKATHQIYEEEDGKKGDRLTSANSRKKQPGKVRLPVGNYILLSRYNDFKKETPFEVKAGETTKIHMVMGQTGNVEISTSEVENGKWVKASGSLYKEDGDRIDGFRTGKKKPATYQLPAGKYYVKMSYNSIEKQVPFEVKPGELTKLHILMGQTGVVESSASESEGGKWIHAGGYVYPLDSDGNKGKWITQIITGKSKADIDRLPVGKYVAELKYNNFQKDVVFEITAGKTLKLHVVFGQFMISAKCPDMNAKVNYEVYASNGRLIEEKQGKCSDTLKMTLDNGEYRVEAKMGEGTTGEAKFTVGTGHPRKLILDLTNLNHEEEIKADSQETVVVPVKPKKECDGKVKSEKISIGGKEIEIKGMSKEDARQLENLGAVLGALGGMMQGTASSAQKEKQNTDNTQADKEFDEMSKDLDMFTK